ncbi:MAG: 50S ribosome-binding GTPase [Zoogloeaceae bacterium]|jgi:bifunctional enzyme CysN/CysC/sulfate adenylyltransferase subunit 1|nr:50S ribosome-binding GTPase [Zoogloeaceae bacterium]
MQPKERMNIVITGHVDHGKSTLVGRLLADTHSLPEGKLEGVREACAANGRVFEYSMLLDALADEQRQGITIDSARVFFKSQKREYVLIDAPGHIEFLRNMLSGASRAAAAILVIDAMEGIAENSRRHGLLLSLLGIGQVVVAINKLDAFAYDEAVFARIRREYAAYLNSLGVVPAAFIAISAREGENIVTASAAMPWHGGPSLLEALDAFENPADAASAPFAMPLQDIYRFSNDGDERRIYAGTVVSGQVEVGEAIRFLPSGKTAHIASLEGWRAPQKTVARAFDACGFTLAEDIYVKSGEVMVKTTEAAPVFAASRLEANMIWLGQASCVANRAYWLKLGHARVKAFLEHVEHVLGDAPPDAEGGPRLRQNDCARVVLRLDAPIALTRFADNQALGRFVLVDGYDAAGAGIVLEGLENPAEAAPAPGWSPDFEDELFALLARAFPHRFADSGLALRTLP